MSQLEHYPDSPLWKYRMAVERLEEKHKEELKVLRFILYDEQMKCPHEKTTYYPDASGNNYSRIECDWCGKEL